MWKRSFIATSVALGSTAEEALSVIDASGDDPELSALVTGLRATSRGARAGALAVAVKEVVLAIDEAALR